MFISFPNLGIQHVTKKNVAKILEERYMAAEMQLSSLNDDYSADMQNAIKGSRVVNSIADKVISSVLK